MEEAAKLSTAAPLAATLPHCGPDDCFTPQQWTTLLALLEVYVPAIGASASSKSSLSTNLDETIARFEPYLEKGTDRALVKTYLEDSFSAIPDGQELLRRKFMLFVPKHGREGLAFIMSALNSTAGSLLLTGSTTLIQDQDLTTRTLIVSKWANSYLGLLRTISRTLSGLSRQVYLQHAPNLEKLLDFTTVPKNLERGPTYDFKFVDFTSSKQSTTLTADAVIIGSGPGAGVTAHTLSNAGMKVIVIEKGYHHNSDHFPMQHVDAEECMFENGGGIPSDDGSIYIKAGSTFGGGGTINWSASLQPPYTVRKEWTEISGLPFFAGQDYQRCLDYICDRMGVPKSNDPNNLAQSIKHSIPNQLLLEGARKLGLGHIIVPQNTGGKTHECGYCSAGCPSVKKQGPVNNWFPDAAEHGAQFIQGCWVEKILFDNSTGSDRIATGVKAHWTSQDNKTKRTITINASRIIVSAGPLQSPLVLHRSGFTNHHIGKNLKLHPVSVVYAVYPFRTNPWDGAILTSAMNGMMFSNPDTRHSRNGPVIENMYGVPGFADMFIPFRANLNSVSDPAAAATQWKLDAAKLGFSTSWISMQRDVGSGEVYQDKSDERRVGVRYTPLKVDRESVVEGQVVAARMAYAVGAREMDVLHTGVSRFAKSEKLDEEGNKAAFELWLQEVRRGGVGADGENGVMGTAHQMGTVRMGASPDRGAIDGKGKLWGARNVWVADASTFPSASGVNPMVSNMGIARWIAEGVVRDWEEGR
jgi:choline dehydrogenase-like flavoprotein